MKRMRLNIPLSFIFFALVVGGEVGAAEEHGATGKSADRSSVPPTEKAAIPKGDGGSLGVGEEGVEAETAGEEDVAGDVEEDGSVLPEESDNPEAEEKSINRTFGEAPEGVVETNRAAEKRRRAKEYFMRGELLFDGGDFAKAAEAFVLAYELVPHQAVLGNIALCYDKAGKWPDAVNYYRSYLSDPVESEENDGIRKRLKELERLVGEISVQCMAKNCRIRVNGIVKGPAPTNVVLLPGEHRVESVVDGDVVESTLVTVGAREFLEISLKGKKESGPPEVVRTELDLAPPPPHSATGQMGPGFWISAGVTFIGAGLVTTFGALTLRTSKDFEKDKTNMELSEQGNRYKLITNIMIGLTCTAAVATIVIAVLDVRRMKKKEHNVAILPAPGFGVVGTF